MRGLKQQALLPGIKPKRKQREPSEENTQADWPPMSEVLHSLLVFEPAAHQPASEQAQASEAPAVPNAPPAPDTDDESARSPVPIVVAGVECGCAAADEMQGAVRRLLINADLVCAGHNMLERLAPAAPGSGDGENAGREWLPLAAPWEEVWQKIAEARSTGLRVLVLADGDPLFFGIGASLTRRMGSDAVRVIPAVSSLQLACARLGLPWHNVLCFSLHGRRNFAPLNAAVGRGLPLCLLMDDVLRPNTVAGYLLDRGVDWFYAHIFENLNLPEESVVHVSLAQAATMDFGPACTVVLTPSAKPRRPRLGLEDENMAVEGGLLTKMPVRAAALALLRIAPEHTVWDIGSGSGAVAVEAAALAHQGRVIAVEGRAERILCIEENRRRFGAAQVDIHLGKAPDCLDGLPEPHRVFIGGGLSAQDGSRLLVHICRRLPPGGRLVASCALMGTLARCRDFFDQAGWFWEIICVQAARSRPLAQDVHLAAMNPIFLLAAQKPEGAS
jgi:precorrin-6Y C5,15-methyltransferase (decarboxylating)